MCTWWVDWEALLSDVAGTEAVVQRAWWAGDGHLNTLTVQIDHSIHLWERKRDGRGHQMKQDTLLNTSGVSGSRFQISDVSTWWQTGAGDALVHTVDVIVEIASGRAHHANPWAGGQGVQVTTVVVAHRVAILHDGRSTAGKRRVFWIFELNVSVTDFTRTIKKKNKCKSKG